MARDVEVNLTASDKTGDALRKAEQQFLRSQERIRKSVDRDQKKQEDDIKTSLGRLAPLVSAVAPQMAGTIAKALSAGGEAIGPVLIGAVGAALPFIGATVSGAIIGGVGIGGVVGGIALAARDPRVAAAGQELAQNLLGRLERSAAPFVGPVLDAIKLVQTRFSEVGGNIDRIFRSSAAFVRPLSDAFTRATQAVIRGVDAITQKAGPVISAIGTGIEGVGEAIEGVFTELATQGPAAAAALQAAFGLVKVTIESIGGSLLILTQAFGLAAKAGLMGSKAQVQIIAYEAATKAASASTDSWAQAVQQTVNAMGTQQAIAIGVTGIMGALKAAVDAVVQANRALYGSDTDVAASLANMNAKLRENGRTHALATAKGRENRQALVQLASVLQTNYENYVKVNGEGAKAAAKGDSLRASFIKAAQGAGYGARAAQDLANKILGIPASRNTKLTADPSGAKSGVAAAQGAINSLHGKTVSVNVIVNQDIRRKVQNTLNRLGGGEAFDASSTWGAGTAGMHRTGGPQQVEVNNTIAVNLDGQPFRDYATRTVNEAQRRSAFRTKVGPRVGSQ